MRQRRFLSWVIVFALLVGMLAIPAYAEGNTATISGDGAADKTGTMTVTLVIPKKTPAAADLTYTAPSDLTYSGSDKAATVAAASGVTGLGTVTVKYYSDAARTTEVTETKNVGTYYVGATVTEGDQYAASTAVVYGDGWMFAITPSTPSAPNAPAKASGSKTTITLNAVNDCEYSKDGASWQDSPEFTGLLPSTEYTFYQRIKATANTNPSAASQGATFSTEADTYGMTITLVVPKKTPAATDMTYTAPADLVYSGYDKAATVVVASGVTGLGTITVKYYSDASRSTEVTETKNVGTYYVGATVAEGDQYAASTAVLYGDGWTFEITKSTPTAPAAPTMASATKNSITLNTVGGCEYSKDGANWQDSPDFTGLLPGMEYTFYQRIKVTANTNPSAASQGATFSTEADTYGMTITLTIEPKITGYALELGGVLGLRYYMALPTSTDIDYTDAKMTFSMNYREDQVIPYSDLETDDQGRFFTCGVYAYQMADEITATFTYKKDGETQILTDTYSVKQYLDSLKGSEYSGAALNLVNATRAYGHFIQPYLARLNGWTVGGKYAELDYTGAVDVNAALAGSEAKKFTLNSMDSAYVQAAQYRLLLNADTSFIVEVRLKETPAGTVSMTIDGTEAAPTVSGTAYRVTVPNIAANNLAVSHRVVMKIGDKTVFDFIASPMSYVYTVLSKSSPAVDEQNALAALYEYWQAADAYDGQN